MISLIRSTLTCNKVKYTFRETCLIWKNCKHRFYTLICWYTTAIDATITMRETPVEFFHIVINQTKLRWHLECFMTNTQRADGTTLFLLEKLAITDGKGAEGLLSKGYMWLREGESETWFLAPDRLQSDQPKFGGGVCVTVSNRRGAARTVLPISVCVCY